MSNYQPIDPIESRKNLKLFNSFTKSKQLFKPRDESEVKWYNCGPTVYDVSHMGHARCYISFDIIRRVLQDYFKYKIKFVQNITDIDDKIIKRARQNYLWNEFESNFAQQINLKNDFEESKEQYKVKIEKEEDPSKKKMLEKQLNEAEQLNGDLTNKDEFVKKGKNVFIEYLDSKKGESVTDNSIFNEFPRKFEDDFYKDMKSLNVLKPDHAPRVSEYVNEIISFIEQIISNGFAYVAESGSVYFNTVSFNKHQLHKYGKLAPEAIGDLSALNEGEGDLSISDKTTKEKLNKNDFALWKSSKAGEPSWPSKWGKGRPGWHIECSTMACDVLGEYADIHSGGIDLRFPHHENEIAQTESYFNTGKNWINYFLHTGHLHIEGCKMSKSLKNFISIKQALQEHSSRLIRLAFLLHSWEDSLDYSRKTMQEAVSYEKTFKEFFFLVENELKNLKESNRQSGDQLNYEWTDFEANLDNDFIKCVQKVNDCLCDNIDTKRCLIELSSLIKSVNTYFDKKENNKIEVNLLKQIAIYITNMLKTFGVIEQNSTEIGFGSACDGQQKSKKEIIFPYVKSLCEFREKVREHAKQIKSNELLKLCDNLRDFILPPLGIKIDDKEIAGKSTSMIKIDEDLLSKDPEVLRREMEEKKMAKEAEDLEKKRKNEEKAREEAAKKSAKDELKKIPPSELFKKEEKYSDFDERGIPRKVDGLEISKSQRKNLEKLYIKQEKLYLEYLNSIQSN